MSAEHLYTRADRIRQLRQLVAALDALIPILAIMPDPPEQLSAYYAARVQAHGLLGKDFSPDETIQLGRSVPDLFSRHRDWEPPAEQLPDGRWRDARWFTEIEEKLQPVLKAAEQLASIGFY